jgi:hypothetical protein
MTPFEPAERAAGSSEQFRPGDIAEEKVSAPAGLLIRGQIAVVLELALTERAIELGAREAEKRYAFERQNVGGFRAFVRK